MGCGIARVWGLGLELGFRVQGQGFRVEGGPEFVRAPAGTTPRQVLRLPDTGSEAPRHHTLFRVDGLWRVLIIFLI